MIAAGHVASQNAALQRLLLELEVTALVVHVLQSTRANHQLLAGDLRFAHHLHAKHGRKEADVTFFWYFAISHVSGVRRMERIVAGAEAVVARRAREAMDRRD